MHPNSIDDLEPDERAGMTLFKGWIESETNEVRQRFFGCIEMMRSEPTFVVPHLRPWFATDMVLGFAARERNKAASNGDAR